MQYLTFMRIWIQKDHIIKILGLFAQKEDKKRLVRFKTLITDRNVCENYVMVTKLVSIF